MKQRYNFQTLRKAWVLVAFTTLFLSSCNNSNDDPDIPKDDYLVESSVITELSKEQIVQQSAAISPLVAGFVRNGVKVYRLTYKTKNTDGSDITASGALILPITTQNVAMVSVQHGTISSDDQAPSNFKANSEGSTIGSLFGAMGYIIAYPDYIGYGASKDLPHPYEHRASLASASLDMLRAAKEFLKKQTDVKWDERLYLAGYSEGGFATLSLQKKIEEEASSEFNLRASSCGAGAYDKTAFMKYLINNETHGIAGFNSSYLWVTLTYDRIYGLNRPKSVYFKEPYAAQIEKLGKDDPINVSFNTIFTESFIKGINDGTDTAFLNAVADNNVYDWKPRTPTQLYHGTADRLVFFFNSKNAYDAMTKRGATNVTLIPVQNGDHDTSLSTYLLGTLTFFTSTQ
ncbi:alpha/beta hydrolase family protein [Salmonirosea aquatica]|uniref:Phospholipase n=1 Tax=Salmonirosea aquatica TaxID=2654236 RepID=A0A7C9F8J0_9BACT|nr:phospholipase [Cytophagaceae bacterium SJW1-29]